MEPPTRAARRATELKRLLVAAAAGAALAVVTLVALGGDGGAATLEGRVLGASTGSSVLVVATRNDCLDPDRRPRELARLLVDGSGPFQLDVAEVGAGVGWLCGYQLPVGGGPTVRYGRVWLPRDGGERTSLELRLAAGPALPDPLRPPDAEPHAGPGAR